MGKLPRFGQDKLKLIREVIRKRCCNYAQGECIALDAGEGCICPQYWSYSLICKWFRRAVLPGEPALEAAILEDRTNKDCCICARPFYAISNRAKYCPDCAAKQRRKQDALRKRIKRRASAFRGEKVR